jgi:hypothetical protein
MDKQTNLLQTFVHYGRNFFITVAQGSIKRCYQLFDKQHMYFIAHALAVRPWVPPQDPNLQ